MSEPRWQSIVLDGTLYEGIGYADRGEAPDLGVGYRRVAVTVVVAEDQVTTVEVVLSPDQIIEALGYLWPIEEPPAEEPTAE